MKSTLYPVLSLRNIHLRDKNIKFYENSHKYIILTDETNSYTSVTTWVHEHFEKFDSDKIIDKMMSSDKWREGHKYWGMSKEQIKTQWSSSNGAEAGTNLHYEIECFNNDKRFQFDYTNKELYEIYWCDNKDKHNSKSIEWQYFINFIKDHQQLKPYRTEWTIYHEDTKIAGSVDMIYENPDGTLSIYDWKRSKNITRINNFNKFSITPLICHLPDSNFWHYALQLNIYKVILETKYDKKIKDLFLVRLHPDSEEKNYELIELPDLSIEIKQLFSERIKHLNNEMI